MQFYNEDNLSFKAGYCSELFKIKKFRIFRKNIVYKIVQLLTAVPAGNLLKKKLIFIQDYMQILILFYDRIKKNLGEESKSCIFHFWSHRTERSNEIFWCVFKHGMKNNFSLYIKYDGRSESFREIRLRKM